MEILHRPASREGAEKFVSFYGFDITSGDTYLSLGWMIPGELGDRAWKGLAALAGSWIGGGANFVAIGESVGATSSTISMMVIVDLAVANAWMMLLLYFEGRDVAMDARIGADRRAVDEVRRKVETFRAAVGRPTDLTSLLRAAPSLYTTYAGGRRWKPTGIRRNYLPINSLIFRAAPAASSA